MVCGIPENINEKGYFDVGRNNLLVLVDMMTACKDDGRINSLALIVNNKTLISSIWSKISSIRVMKLEINTHYLIVFKNPRDD